MLHLLAKAFIPRCDDPADPAVRRAYGTLCGAVGIALNLLLFAAKCIVGVVSGSVAIAADALNNLSDAGSSLVALLGFRLAGKKPDRDHPFGHGRLEYVSGLAVAGLILLMAVELAKSSVERILHPQSVTFTAVTAVCGPGGTTFLALLLAVERRDARGEFVVRQLPFRQHVEQNVEVVGHHRIGVDLHPAEGRHPAYLVDDVRLVIVVEAEGPVHAAAADMVEALAIVLQSQLSHGRESPFGNGARRDAAIPRIYIKSFFSRISAKIFGRDSL